jgi:hypothetical protein
MTAPTPAIIGASVELDYCSHSKEELFQDNASLTDMLPQDRQQQKKLCEEQPLPFAPNCSHWKSYNIIQAYHNRMYVYTQQLQHKLIDTNSAIYHIVSICRLFSLFSLRNIHSCNYHTKLQIINLEAV